MTTEERLEHILSKMENGTDYRGLSWGDKKKQYLEDLIIKRDIFVTKIFRLIDENKLTPELEKELNIQYFVKKHTIDRILEKDEELTLWVRKNVYDPSFH